MDHNIKKLINQMTLEEKASLCSGLDFWHLKGIDRLSIPSIMVTDGPHGLRKQDGESDHVGLSDSVKATCFPTASATASSWDVNLLGEMGVALAEECIQEDVSVLLGPGANIKRSPLCGRNFEYISEDPYLTGKIGSALVNGVQSKGIGTSLKHFAVNNQEYRRMVIESVLDERTLREIYLAGFEEIVKSSQPWTIMCAYNKYNSEYCSDSKMLLTDILKKEWGHTGLVVTDWGACNDRVTGIEVGMELEMPASGGLNDQKIITAVKSNILSESKLDESVYRVLDLIQKSTETERGNYQYDVKAHHALARKIASQSAVLLKNEGVLPLQESEHIAIIGEFASAPRYQGAGSSQIQPIILSSAIETLDEKSISYDYYKGYDKKSHEPIQVLIDEAVAGALKSKTAVLFIGLTDEYESEGFDRKHMNIPDAHLSLLNAVTKTYEKVVVVLQNGSPIEMAWLDDVSAVLECYLGGQAGGPASVDLLYGDVNPSGKLAETFPMTLEDDLATKWFGMGPQTVEYRESIYVGYRYYDSAQLDVRFPFGYGLSYTSFEYSNLSLNRSGDKDSNDVTVTFDVKNTGHLAGAEVTQLYVKDIESTIFRADKELKGFEKLFLYPGETKTVTMLLNKRSFAYYNTVIKDWHVESGLFDILIGASSRDIRLSESIDITSSREEVKVPDYRKSASIYYDLNENNNVIDDISFEAILGRKLEKNRAPQNELFTINSTLGDVNNNMIGKLLYKKIGKSMTSMLGDNPDDSTKLMMEAMMDEMPIRSLVLMGNGALSFEVAEGMILMMNGKFIKGLGKIIKNN